MSKSIWIIIVLLFYILAMNVRVASAQSTIVPQYEDGQTVYRYDYVGMDLIDIQRDDTAFIAVDAFNMRYQTVYVGMFHSYKDGGGAPVAVCESARCYMAVFSYMKNELSFPVDNSILHAPNVRYVDMDLSYVSAFGYSSFALIGNLEGLMTQNFIRYLFIVPVALMMAYRIIRFIVGLARKNKENAEEYIEGTPFTVSEGKMLGITNDLDPDDGFSHE